MYHLCPWLISQSHFSSILAMISACQAESFTYIIQPMHMLGQILSLSNFQNGRMGKYKYFLNRVVKNLVYHRMPRIYLFKIKSHHIFFPNWWSVNFAKIRKLNFLHTNQYWAKLAKILQKCFEYFCNIDRPSFWRKIWCFLNLNEYMYDISMVHESRYSRDCKNGCRLSSRTRYCLVHVTEEDRVESLQ